MAGYFSNHSQSRFLANSNSSSAAGQPADAHAQNLPTTPGRVRAPSSRHFSTSLSGSGDEKSTVKEKNAGTGGANGAASVHPLRNTYVRTFTRKERVIALTVFIAAGCSGSASSARQGTRSRTMKRGLRRSLRLAPYVPFLALHVTALTQGCPSPGRVVLVTMDAH